MEIIEMYQNIERVEKLTKRGLLTVCEAEERINKFIENAFPWDAYTTAEKWEALMKEKRLAHRRKWRFLLDLSKDIERIC